MSVDDSVVVEVSSYQPSKGGKTPPVESKKLYWVSGTGLLYLAQWAVEGLNISGHAAVGDGTFDKPWNLTGDPRVWLSVAKALRSNTGRSCYMYICGRIVKKISGGYYMVDAGGTGTKGRAWDQKAFWNNRLRKWDWEGFERGGPSYRNFSNYMEEIRRDSKKALSEEVWAQHKAEKLRRVLKCDPLYEAKLKEKSDWTTGQVLPVLAATMFLAEPARNIRAFVANRVLLDLMEAGITYSGRTSQYVWGTTLWRDPHERGGDMPAAMTGSGEAGRIAIAPDVSKLGTGQYTQAKEVALICHLFSSLMAFKGAEAKNINKSTHTQLVCNADPPLNPHGTMTTKEEILGWMKYLIQYTIKDWRL